MNCAKLLNFLTFVCKTIREITRRADCVTRKALLDKNRPCGFLCKLLIINV